MIVWGAALLIAGLPQQPATAGARAVEPPTFVVVDGSSPPRVSGDRPGIGATPALQELGDVLGWQVVFATHELRSELERVTLDLSFDDRDARTIAHLIAAAGDADVVFDDRSGPDGGTTVLHVVPAPSAATESGRQRLRRWAMQWYQRFLADDQRQQPLVAEKAMEVRMHLGDLLLQQGLVQDAIKDFQEVHDADPSHPYVPQALLKMAQAYYDLGQLDQAEHWSREVAQLNPARPETAQATVLLGRVLLAQGRYDECVAEMRAALLPLAGTPEVVDLVLLIADAHRHRGRPDYVLDQMRLLAKRHDFHELSRQQWLDYHFLRGFGAEGTGQTAEAIEALEIFLATSAGDPRRAEAFVMLARAYLTAEKYVEARAAALQALAQKGKLSPELRRESRIVQARTALALGDEDSALEDLEREVRRDPTGSPELILYTVQANIDAERYEKAVAVAELLTHVEGRVGDQARVLDLQARWLQAQKGPKPDLMRGFLEHAREVAPHIADEEMQRKAAELIGKAYASIGDWDHALEAYLGVLR